MYSVQLSLGGPPPKDLPQGSVHDGLPRSFTISPSVSPMRIAPKRRQDESCDSKPIQCSGLRFRQPQANRRRLCVSCRLATKSEANENLTGYSRLAKHPHRIHVVQALPLDNLPAVSQNSHRRTKGETTSLSPPDIPPALPEIFRGILCLPQWFPL